MEDENNEDIPTDELVETNDMYLETLIELLKEKGVFTGAEFDKMLNKLYPDEE